MTQEEKVLLLKDLSARLPYGVICKSVNFKNPTTLVTIDLDGPLHSVYFCTNDEGSMWNDYDDIKPYLFPLSSMTAEQKRELLTLTGYDIRCEESCGFDSWGFYINTVGEYRYEDNQESIILYPDYKAIDWLNKNHFDYRGLIPRGLAHDATDKNIY